MKAVVVFVSVFMMAGCSSSVRPLYSGVDQGSTQAHPRAASLDLPLSDHSQAALSEALAQGERYCATLDQALQVSLAGTDAGTSEVPVVHINCVP